MKIMVDELYELHKDKGVTKVVGVESRGFVLGGVIAARLGCEFVMCRKPGKLPANIISETYLKEYGEDTIEIQSDAICENDIILIHDVVLATGGSILAVCKLVKKCNPAKTYINVLAELSTCGLNGRSKLPKDMEFSTLISI